MHAQLQQGGTIIGGAGRRGDQWVLFLDGRAATATDSAAMMLAMLTHAATRRSPGGDEVLLSYSTTLRDAATLEARTAGKTLHEYLAMLEAERVERVERVERGQESAQ